MAPVILTPPEQRWECPSCGLLDVTHEQRTHTQMHPCPALGGLLTPMVPAGSKARHVAREREDYVGSDLVQLDDNGRPVMSLTTEHDDGRQDCMIFAPAASAHGSI